MSHRSVKKFIFIYFVQVFLGNRLSVIISDVPSRLKHDFENIRVVAYFEFFRIIYQRMLSSRNVSEVQISLCLMFLWVESVTVFCSSPWDFLFNLFPFPQKISPAFLLNSPWNFFGNFLYVFLSLESTKAAISPFLNDWYRERLLLGDILF